MHHVKCIWDILRLMEDKCLLVFVVLLNLQTAHALSRNTFTFKRTTIVSKQLDEFNGVPMKPLTSYFWNLV